MPLWSPLDLPQIDVGTSDEPEALVRGAFLLQVFGEQVGVHLGREEGHPGFFFGHAVDVFGSFGIEFEGGEDEDGGFRAKRSRFFPGEFDLPLFEQAVFGAEGNDDALGLCAFGFGVGVQPARAGQRLDAGEVDVVAAFAAKSGFEQFVAPFGVAKRRAGAGDGSIEQWRGAWRKSASDCWGFARWPDRGLPISMSSSDLTVGAGTASTVNGPVTRTRLLSM